MGTPRPAHAFTLALWAVLSASVATPQTRPSGAPISIKGELTHGWDQAEDLEAQSGPTGDQDVFRMSQKSHASYEVVVDSTSGDIGTGSGPSVQRLAPDGTTVLETSAAIGTGSSRSLRWENTSAADVDDQFVRVQSSGCTTNCGSRDVYRIRAYETTYSVPRFNNAGTQITVLLLQNPASYAVNGHAWFWSPGGSLLGSAVFALGAKQMLVLNTATVPGVAGQGGTISVSNDARYGDLSGKTVALEPSTGFSFDTPMEPRRPAPAVDANGTCQGKPESRACYTGPPGTSGVGVCRAGSQSCVSGAFDGACTGAVLPSAEACNGLDDDCNGAVDDGLGTITCGIGACQVTVPACAGGSPGTCTPGAGSAEICDGIDNDCNGVIDDPCNCVFVAPTGNDGNPGTATLPKRTIGAAITVAGTMGLPNRVCVAASSNCAGVLTTFDYAEAVTMRDGIHVYGGYQSAPTFPWGRFPNCITRIVDQDQRGAYFGATVTAATMLDGFTIAGQIAPTSAAVTVEGSTGAVVNNDIVTGAGMATSYGVNVIDSAGTAARPALTNNSITGGNGTALAVGVRALNSAPVIRANCSAFDASGRCTAFCGTATRFIRGRTGVGIGAESYGVRLESSPGAVLDQNSACSNGSSTTRAAGVRISGDAAGVSIRANGLYGTGGQQDAVGIWADPCAGASPWVVNNLQIAGSSATAGARADGVRAVGDCHVRVDHNVRIIGGIEGGAGATNGVFCAKDVGSGVASRCTILGNTQIDGSAAGFPPISAGVRCDDGACARIENNAINGRGGQRAFGLVLGNSGTWVDANVIRAGCVQLEGTGLLASDSFARVQNNQIFGADSLCSAGAPTSYAARVVLGAGTNEVDLNSNDLFAEGTATACISRGIAWDVSGAGPPAPRGIVRNNIVFGGNCNQSYDVDEMNAMADPRVLQNNDLWHNAALTALYRDEVTTNLTTIAAVNALSDITASGNISADPAYVAGHISAASPCRNAGTALGAPVRDFEGDPRPQESIWDIGRDEFVP